MRKRKIFLLAFTVVLLSAFTPAQTLDEVLHPLLQKGQWDLSLDYKNYGYEYFSIDLFHGEMTYFDSRVILFPRLAFGLAKNLQLTIDGAYQFPITFSSPQFDEWDYWRETNTIRSLSAQLLFRPAANMELRLFLLHGLAENDVHYPRSWGIDAHYTENFTGNILILGGTWLSKVDDENRPLRADLEGLHGPLLKKRRWQLEPEILIRSHKYECRETLSVIPDYFNENIDSTDLRLRLAASHGLTNHVQIQADCYWQPRFRMKDVGNAMLTWLGEPHYQEHKEIQLFNYIFGVRLKLTWRFSPQTEIFLAASRSQLETASQSATTGAISVGSQHNFSQIELGGAWLSRLKQPGVVLTANLPGIHLPLLEKKQFKLDGKIYFRSYRIPNEHYDDYFKGLQNSDYWLFRLQSAYGMFNSLQVSIYYGVSLSKHLFTGFKYEKDYSLGGELKWRLKKRAEIYAAFNYKPWFFLDKFPPFLLSINDFSSQHHDFLGRNLGESINIELGCRFVF